MIEKREHARKLLATDAYIADEIGGWSTIRLFDISKAGIAFLSPHDIPLNSLHTFCIWLPESPKSITFVAIVLHSSPLAGGYRMGARFTGIDEEDVYLIKDYVNALNS